MKIHKRFRSAYVLDEAKLRRLLDVIDQAFKESGSDYKIDFEVHQPQRKVTTVNSIEQLLLLDNSKRYPIESLLITATTPKNNEDDDELTSRNCEVLFSDDDIVACVDYEVSSSDTNWVNNCSTLLVEQIERTLQSGLIMKLNVSQPFRTMMIPLISTLFILIIISLIPLKEKSRISNQMWLTDSDIARISKSEKAISPSDVLDMQIKNIQKIKSDSKLKWLKDWRVYAAFSPLMLVLACLIYLVFYCYPPTVFNWGDMGDYYEILLGRRKILWSAIIIGIFVGLLANLAVYGLVDLAKS